MEEVSLKLDHNSFNSLIGPSGCGKSTLMRLTLGLEQPDSGQIKLNGADPEAATKKGIVGVAFQDSALLPWRNVERNISLPLEILGTSPTKYESKIAYLIDLVGLSKFNKSFPGELSGGMRQRVAIARALVTDPKILLLDEPFAALDQILRKQLNTEMQRIWMEKNYTALLVTHSVDEAVFLSDKVIVMKRAPGKIIREFDIPFSRPRSIALFTDSSFLRYTEKINAALYEGQVSA